MRERRRGPSAPTRSGDSRISLVDGKLLLIGHELLWRLTLPARNFHRPSTNKTSGIKEPDFGAKATKIKPVESWRELSTPGFV